MLCPTIYQPNVEKKYNIGIIPHISELNNPIVNKFIAEGEDDIVLIDFKNYKSWETVIQLICECRIIASSSLHGLILSDAYGIPNVWLCLNPKTGGGEFKFMDYFAGVARKYERYDVIDNISSKIIKDYCNNYKGIKFDSKALLNSCPFL